MLNKDMSKVAILLTVHNRKEVTIIGLSSLFNAIQEVKEYTFDIYMVNDGCTDGTEEDVCKIYPNVNIINGNGNLFWSRGMNLAWKTAVETDSYDYFLWFNDDAILYKNAIKCLFQSIDDLGDTSIITGAFKDGKNIASYGGRNKYNKILVPNGSYQNVHLMNGNLVLIPRKVFDEIGFIDSHFHHGLGDWDYGLSAQTKGFKVMLTKEYVGVTDRHDKAIPSYFNPHNNLVKRFELLYSPLHSINCRTYFFRKHFGIFKGSVK